MKASDVARTMKLRENHDILYIFYTAQSYKDRKRKDYQSFMWHSSAILLFVEASEVGKNDGNG